MPDLFQRLAESAQQEFVQNPIQVTAAIVGVFALVLGGVFALLRRWRSRSAAEPSALAVQRFEKIWGQVSEALQRDLEQSRRSALEAIHAAHNDSFTHLRHFPNQELYDLHWSEIVAYDPGMAKALQAYGQEAKALNHAKHVYDDLKYKNDPPEDLLEQARSEMQQRGHKMADLIDHTLEPMVKRYDNLLARAS